MQHQQTVQKHHQLSISNTKAMCIEQKIIKTTEVTANKAPTEELLSNTRDSRHRFEAVKTDSNNKKENKMVISLQTQNYLKYRKGGEYKNTNNGNTQMI